MLIEEYLQYCIYKQYLSNSPSKNPSIILTYIFNYKFKTINLKLAIVISLPNKFYICNIYLSNSQTFLIDKLEEFNVVEYFNRRFQ